MSPGRGLFPDISEPARELIHFLVRKTAHLGEYGFLAFLILRALLIGGQPAVPAAALLALSLATAFAAADETRQSLSGSRLGSGLDVALDALGAGAGIGLLLLARFQRTATGQRIGLSGFRPGAPPEEPKTGLGK